MISSIFKKKLDFEFKKFGRSREEVEKVFRYFLNFHVENAIFLQKYSEVIDWLHDNKGCSLLLAGGCGQGKSILTHKVIPDVLNSLYNLRATTFSSYDINEHTSEVLNAPILSIDEVGREGVKNDYGNKQSVFFRLLNIQEQEGRLIISNTNILDEDKLIELYGIEVADRIHGNFKTIVLNGKSLRKNKFKN